MTIGILSRVNFQRVSIRDSLYAEIILGGRPISISILLIRQMTPNPKEIVYLSMNAEKPLCLTR